MSQVEYVNLQILPMQANPKPPIGSQLGQKKVDIMKFCRTFNEQSKDMDKDLKVKVIVAVSKDGSFSFEIKTPLTTALIKKISGIEKGSDSSSVKKVAKLTYDQVKDIAKIKLADLTAADMNGAIRTIIGTARNMGVEVEDHK